MTTSLRMFSQLIEPGTITELPEYHDNQKGVELDMGVTTDLQGSAGPSFVPRLLGCVANLVETSTTIALGIHSSHIFAPLTLPYIFTILLL